MSQKIKFTNIVGLLALLCLVIYIIGHGITFIRETFIYYETPKQAVEKFYGHESIEIIKTLQKDDVAIMAYRVGLTVGTDCLRSNKRGWKVEKSTLLNSKVKHSKGISGYTLTVTSIKKKKLIIITAPFNPVGGDPKDSLNSEFTALQIPFGDKVLYKWLLILENPPKDYVITVDGKEMTL